MKIATQKLLIAIIVCITLIGSAFVYKSGFSFPVISDADDYHQIASTLVTDGYYKTISDKEIIYPPLYPLMLAGVYKLFGIGNTSAVYTLQYIFVGIIALFTFFVLTKRLKMHALLGLTGALLILFWPYFLTYTFIVASEILYTLLLVMALYVLTKDTPTTKTYLLAGLCFGLATLTRPVSLLLPLFIIIGSPIIALLFAKKDIVVPAISIRNSLFLIGIFVITLLPWEMYIAHTYQRFIPVASNLSYVFDKANTTQSYLATSETEIAQHSLIEAKIKNVYLFWNPGASGYQAELITEKFPMAEAGIVLYKIIFYLLVVSVLLGTMFVVRTMPTIPMLIYPILYTWSLHIVLFPFPRYTLPIMPFVIIVALTIFAYGYNQYKTVYSHRFTSEE